MRSILIHADLSANARPADGPTGCRIMSRPRHSRTSRELVGRPTARHGPRRFELSSDSSGGSRAAAQTKQAQGQELERTRLSLKVPSAFRRRMAC